MPMSGRIVISGAGGQLGATLAALAAEQGRDVRAYTSSQCDITDPAAAGRLIGGGDVVINCAAYTDVDGAESDEARAYAVNAAGPEHLAKACARAGAQLIHVSTDYVFGGEVFVARPRGLFGPGDPPLLPRLLKVAERRPLLAAAIAPERPVDETEDARLDRVMHEFGMALREFEPRIGRAGAARDP